MGHCLDTFPVKRLSQKDKIKANKVFSHVPGWHSVAIEHILPALPAPDLRREGYRTPRGGYSSGPGCARHLRRPLIGGLEGWRFPRGRPRRTSNRCLGLRARKRTLWMIGIIFAVFLNVVGVELRKLWRVNAVLSCFVFSGVPLRRVHQASAEIRNLLGWVLWPQNLFQRQSIGYYCMFEVMAISVWAYFQKIP